MEAGDSELVLLDIHESYPTLAFVSRPTAAIRAEPRRKQGERYSIILGNFIRFRLA
jgi:hypothetical protein